MYIVGNVRPNVPLLSTFMAVFGLLVGPLNIFVFARRRRERLFWTTPLISVSASLLLMGMIIGRDGSGGHGLRTAVVCLFPQSRMQVVMQDQTSRSGLLLGASFSTADPAYIRQAPADPPAAKGRALQYDRGVYGGHWFESRAVQSQRAITASPSRAEVTLLNPVETGSGAAPIVVSSIAATLDPLIYRGQDGRHWIGHNVRTGQKQTLEPAAEDHLFRPPATMDEPAPGMGGAERQFLGAGNRQHRLPRDAEIDPLDRRLCYLRRAG